MIQLFSGVPEAGFITLAAALAGKPFLNHLISKPATKGSTDEPS